jgi:hypothetical protein
MELLQFYYSAISLGSSGDLLKTYRGLSRRNVIIFQVGQAQRDRS